MRKVERLKWIEGIFGPEYVLPYRVCHNWKEIEAAARCFEAQGRTWGMRTDRVSGLSQALGLPFLHRGTLQEAKKVWKAYGQACEYIISHNILLSLCHAVAKVLPYYPDYTFFEYNDVERGISQRAMYEKPENVKHLIVGPLRRSRLHFNQFNEWDGRVFQSEDSEIVRLRFDTMYTLIQECLLSGREIGEEVTFTVCLPSKAIVIW